MALEPTKARTEETLDAKLDAYGRKTGADLRLAARPGKVGPAIAFSIAAAATLAAPDVASATVIMNTGGTVTANDINTSASIKLSGFKLNAYWGGASSQSVRFQNDNLISEIARVATEAKTGPVLPFAAGSTVGPTLDFGKNDGLLGSLDGEKIGGPFGSLSASETGFIGFRIAQAPTGDDKTHYDYAWAELSIALTADHASATVLRWAYESQIDTAITIPGGVPTGIVPEPASLTLIGCLALGAKGLAEMRRRRAAQRKASSPA